MVAPLNSLWASWVDGDSSLYEAPLESSMSHPSEKDNRRQPLGQRAERPILTYVRYCMRRGRLWLDDNTSFGSSFDCCVAQSIRQYRWLGSDINKSDTLPSYPQSIPSSASMGFWLQRRSIDKSQATVISVVTMTIAITAIPHLIG